MSNAAQCSTLFGNPIYIEVPDLIFKTDFFNFQFNFGRALALPGAAHVTAYVPGPPAGRGIPAARGIPARGVVAARRVPPPKMPKCQNKVRFKTVAIVLSCTNNLIFNFS